MAIEKRSFYNLHHVDLVLFPRHVQPGRRRLETWGREPRGIDAVAHFGQRDLFRLPKDADLSADQPITPDFTPICFDKKASETVLAGEDPAASAGRKPRVSNGADLPKDHR